MLAGFIAFLFLLLAIEFCWFYSVLQKRTDFRSVDVIVVFGGESARTVKGYGLANQGLSSNIIISPASAERLKNLDKTYRIKKQYNYIIEDRATTTFQNAVLSAYLIRKHEFKSALLVTSDYHMPRSFFLLKLKLLGQGVSLIPWPVENDHFVSNPFAWTKIQKKIVYNEMIDFWGSLAEMLHNGVTDQLPKKTWESNKILSWLRSVLLFDVGG